jgi:hypothetical protein
MSQITLRIAKGSALTQSEMDDNLRNFINSASVDITTGQLTLFTSESSGAEKQIDVKPTWVGYSGSSTTGVASITGSLLVTGDITAQQFNTEIISSSTIFESGSTIFGDDSNDTHQITGSLLITGSQVLSGSQTISGSSTITGEIDSTGMSSKIRFHFNEFDDLPSATTYHGMFAHVHATGSAYYAHSGNWVRLAQSASFAIPIATLTDASASHETSITTLFAASSSHETAINILNSKTLISSSDQISDEISGSLSNDAIGALGAKIISSSAQTIANLPTGSVSSSIQLADEISGSLGVNAALIRSLTGTVISGSFTSTSASLAANIATNLASVGTLTTDKANKSEISGSLGVNAALIRSLTGTAISGSLGVNATLIRSLTGDIITGSFAADSGSFTTRIETLEAASGTVPGLISSSAEGSTQGTLELNGVDVNVKNLQTSSNVQFNDVQVDSFGVGTAASSVNGEIRATNDITAFYSSDKRLKENIVNIKDPLEKLSYINGVEFDWIPKEGIHSHEGHDVGVIAQEIEKVLPELVTDRDNGYKAVRYEKIVALLIEAVKEQQLQIDELKSKL